MGATAARGENMEAQNTREREYLSQAAVCERSAAASAHPGVHLHRLLAIPQGALVRSASRVGDDAVEARVVDRGLPGFHDRIRL